MSSFDTQQSAEYFPSSMSIRLNGPALFPLCLCAKFSWKDRIWISNGRGGLSLQTGQRETGRPREWRPLLRPLTGYLKFQPSYRVTHWGEIRQIYLCLPRLNQHNNGANQPANPPESLWSAKFSLSTSLIIFLKNWKQLRTIMQMTHALKVSILT